MQYFKEGRISERLCSLLRKNKTLLISLFVMLLWGSLFPAVKLGMKSWNIESTGDILLFAGVRFVICGGVIALFSLKDKSSYKSARSVIFPILMSGFFSIILHYACTYSALGMTDAEWKKSDDPGEA